MPETSLNTKATSSHEQLAARSGLSGADRTKPLLLQIVEQLQSGEVGGTKIQPSQGSSPNAAPGVQFSEEKGSRAQALINVGDGILGNQRTNSSPEQKPSKNI